MRVIGRRAPVTSVKPPDEQRQTPVLVSLKRWKAQAKSQGNAVAAVLKLIGAPVGNRAKAPQ